MKTILHAVLALLLLTAPMAVQAQFDYIVNTDNTIAITGYYGPGGAVTIPTNINGLTVTSIKYWAFLGKHSLTSVTILGSVTNIGFEAFSGCTSLTAITVDTNNSVYSSLYGVLYDKSKTTLVEYPGGISGSYMIPDSVLSIADDAFNSCANLSGVTIPNSVTNIGGLVFAFCSSLWVVTIPASVTSIGLVAFADCTSLTAITVDTNNTVYSSLHGVLFDKSQTTLVEYPGGNSGSYMIPGSVLSIAEDAFNGCANLSGVTIPASVTSIGYAAFASTGLSGVTIPASVTILVEGAFDSCTNLSSVYFKGNAPVGGFDGFFGEFATAYYLPGTVGWSSDWAVLWNPLIQTGTSTFGISNNQFGFNITGTANIPIAVEVCTNLARPVWVPLQTLTLTNGSFYFSQPLQANSSGHFYRISSP